jgi:predicted Zn-dependent protease
VIERLLTAERALEAGEVDAADRLFAQVAAADPRNAIAVVGLARVAQRRGDLAGAAAEARRALEIDPDDGAAQRMLGELSAAADHAAASPSTSPRPGVLAWLRGLFRR